MFRLGEELAIGAESPAVTVLGRFRAGGVPEHGGKGVCEGMPESVEKLTSL